MSVRSKFTIQHISSSNGTLILKGGSSTGTEQYVPGMHVSGSLSIQSFGEHGGQAAPSMPFTNDSVD